VKLVLTVLAVLLVVEVVGAGPDLFVRLLVVLGIFVFWYFWQILWVLLWVWVDFG
jgi:hypothetical protein